MTTPDHIRAHRHCRHHREELESGVKCGCFCCLAIFPPSEIREWVHTREGVGRTALCPRCGINSVIGSESGYPVSKEFLAEMEGHWFRTTAKKIRASTGK